MARIVQKVGGSLLKDLISIFATGYRAYELAEEGNEVALVVSAVFSRTNDLRKLEETNFLGNYPEEKSLLFSIGEQEACALMTMAIKDLGGKAEAFTAQKMSLKTFAEADNAQVHSVNIEKIEASLKSGNIVVVAGFQGIDENMNITTLGLGGSDITAVVLAAELKADVCQLFKDTGGILSADPKIVGDKAKLISFITYDQLIEMASSGAKVINPRAAILAKKRGVKIEIVSENPEIKEKTIVVKEEEMSSIEEAIVSSIVPSYKDMMLIIKGVPDKPGVAGKIISFLRSKGIKHHHMIQNESGAGKTDITFVILKDDEKKLGKDFPENAPFEFEEVIYEREITSVSIIGIGLKSNDDISGEVCSILGENDINIKVIFASETKVYIIVSENLADLVIRSLHSKFFE